MKVLNLYCGIGGNRKLWQNVEVTAVEIDENIAAIYSDLFPQDEIIIGDAHEYLLENYKNYDFIWSSPPCPTHSQTIFFNHIKKRYPDMSLYQEIIFLKHFATAIWVVENVQPYYEPLLAGQKLGRHLFWSNFFISNGIKSQKVRNDKGKTLNEKMKDRNIEINNWHNYKGDKRKLINSCVDPEVGLHVLESAISTLPPIQQDFFGDNVSKNSA